MSIFISIDKLVCAMKSLRTILARECHTSTRRDFTVNVHMYSLRKYTTSQNRVVGFNLQAYHVGIKRCYCYMQGGKYKDKMYLYGKVYQ